MARPEGTSGKGKSNSHSALGVTGGRRVLKLRCRKHMASGAIPNRPCSCDGHDFPAEDLHPPNSCVQTARRGRSFGNEW